MQDKIREEEAKRIDKESRTASFSPLNSSGAPVRTMSRGDMLKKMREDEAKRIQAHPISNSSIGTQAPGNTWQPRKPAVLTLEEIQRKNREEEAKRIAQENQPVRNPSSFGSTRPPSSPSVVVVNMTLEQVKQRTRDEEAKRIQQVYFLLLFFLLFIKLYLFFKKDFEKQERERLRLG